VIRAQGFGCETGGEGAAGRCRVRHDSSQGVALATYHLLLATSYFLLPTSYFLLPTSYFLLPTYY
jgi:hypothetical protein